MDNKLGPTGKFPKGKLGPNDEGELALGVANDNGLVVVNFGTRVKWFGMPPQEAADFAAVIIKHAREAAKAAGVPLTVQL